MHGIELEERRNGVAVTLVAGGAAAWTVHATVDGAAMLSGAPPLPPALIHCLQAPPAAASILTPVLTPAPSSLPPTGNYNNRMVECGGLMEDQLGGATCVIEGGWQRASLAACCCACCRLLPLRLLLLPAAAACC